MDRKSKFTSCMTRWSKFPDLTIEPIRQVIGDFDRIAFRKPCRPKWARSSRRVDSGRNVGQGSSRQMLIEVKNRC